LDKRGFAVQPNPRLYLPSGSIKLTVWLQFVMARFRYESPNLSIPWEHEGGTPSNTRCRWTPQMSTCQMASKNVKQFKRQVHECAQIDSCTDATDDKHTDSPCYGETCKNRWYYLRCKSWVIPLNSDNKEFVWNLVQ